MGDHGPREQLVQARVGAAKAAGVAAAGTGFARQLPPRFLPDRPNGRGQALEMDKLVVGGTVRVPIAKLDARLLQAEDMLSLKSVMERIGRRGLKDHSLMLSDWAQAVGERRSGGQGDSPGSGRVGLNRPRAAFHRRTCGGGFF